MIVSLDPKRFGAMALLAVLAAPLWTICAHAQEISRTENKPAEVTMKEARKKAAHRQRRIIFNNDGNDCRDPKPGEPRTPENFLSKRTTALVGSQVDAIFYCTGVFNLYTHKSEESEMERHGDQYAEDWAWELAQQGRDSLQVMVDFGHQHGMEVFWTMRMNDTHDSADPALLCRWKKAHPEYLMGKPDDKLVSGGRRWSAVNYGVPEVREKVFRILKDVYSRYDVDGIEMDFFRHPIYFKPQVLGQPVTQEHCDMMTDLVRRVRRMTEEAALKHGRPLLVAVRVPDSAGYCAAIGLDLKRWLQEDLIDLMAVTCYFQLSPWEESVRLGHQYGVPVYPCLSESRIKGEAGKMRHSLQTYRARAMNAWNSGADGIYIFNYFNPRAALWRELGDAKALEKLDKDYFVSARSAREAGWWLLGGKQFVTLPHLSPEDPLTLRPGEKQIVTLPVGDDVRWGESEGIVPDLKLRLQFDKLAKAEDVSITLNGQPLRNGGLSGEWMEYALRLEQIVKGGNRFEIVAGPQCKAAPVLKDLLLTVRYRRSK